MAAKIKKNDTVLVISGRERGKRGKVARVIAEDNRAVIEGVNLVKRHSKPRGMGQPGGIIEKEAALHLSNMMLICTKCERPVRVGFTRLEDGSKVRMCRKCGEVIE